MADYRAFEQKYPTFSKFVGAAREAASVMPGASYLTPASPIASDRQQQSYADARQRFQTESPAAAEAGRSVGYGVDLAATSAGLGALGGLAGAGSGAVLPTVGAIATGVKNAASLIPSAIGGAAKAANYAPLAIPLAAPFSSYLKGDTAKASTPPIAVDAQGNFSRAPSNPEEYKQAMEAKYGKPQPASMAPSNDEIRAAYERQGISVPGSKPTSSAPKQTMSYDDWVMKQPTSKLNAEDYARRAQLEIQKRAPATLQENIMNATNYALSHPDMVTSREVTKNGTRETYGDRSANAIANYSTFKNALANEETAKYADVRAQALLDRANRGTMRGDEKALAIQGALQDVFSGIAPGTALPDIKDMPARRQKFANALIAAKAMGGELPYTTFEEAADAFGYPTQAQGSGWWPF